MYGTVAKMRIKPGMLPRLQAMAASDDMTNTPGLVSTTVYQMDTDADVFIMCVVFTDKEAYFKNANSPEQNKRYDEFAALLDGPPEWNDGEIVFPMK